MMTATRGNHVIRVDLGAFHANVDKVFFVLSAWDTPVIADFPDPGVRMFEDRAPDKELCRCVVNWRERERLRCQHGRITLAGRTEIMLCTWEPPNSNQYVE
jgi:hypothetical protein